jgi:hypothetical protein
VTPPADPLSRLAELEGVGSAMAAARDGIDALLRDRGLRRSTPELTAESLLRGAHASAALEGSAATLEQLRAGLGDETARSAVRVSTELLAWVPTLSAAPLQALARLHTVAAKGQVPDDALGRPRDAAAAARLRDLGRLLTGPTRAPALVMAAVAHAELVVTAPFASHDAILARAVERLVLVSRGVDPASLVVPEAGHLRLRREYESNLRGYAEGGARGVHAWPLYAAQAYAAAAEASPLAPGRAGGASG